MIFTKRSGTGSAHSRWWLQTSRRVPVLLQLTVAECGAACLAMVLSALGRPTRVAECRERMDVGRGGVTALAIAQVARTLGLRVQALRLTPEELGEVALPAIVHWGGNHFVVVEHWSPQWVTIVDPAAGRRRLSAEAFAAGYSGVTLIFVADQPFAPDQPAQRLTWLTYVRPVLALPEIRPLLATVAGITLLLQLFGLTLPFTVTVLVDQVLPAQLSDPLALLGLGLLLMVIAQALLSYGRALLLLRLELRLDEQLTRRFFAQVLRLPLRMFHERTAGDLLQRLESNATIREALAGQMLASIFDAGLVVVYLGIIMFHAPLLGLLVASIGLLQLLLFARFAPSLHMLTQQGLGAQADEQGHLVEVLTGMTTVKAAGAEPWALARWDGLFQRSLHSRNRRGIVAAQLDSALELLGAFAPLLLLWVGAWMVLNGALTAGAMLALNVLAISCLTPLRSIIGHAQQLQLVRAHLDRLLDVMEVLPEQAGQSLQQAPRLSGRIALCDVSFRYDAHTAPVLQNVSLTIEAGQSVAIVGRTGSGKTTLARLLLGMHPPSSGSILYDGLLLERLDYRSVRAQYGVVPQEIHLFSGTIGQNIALHAPEASQAQIVDAARQALIHDEIAQLPMGYETMLSEGWGLSGGQRQRIALARALMHQPSILLLDEATSHLDAQTEHLVEQNLRLHAGTRISIAHRLSSIRHADLIVVLSQGRVAEQGTHAELLAGGGIYAGLICDQLEDETRVDQV